MADSIMTGVEDETGAFLTYTLSPSPVVLQLLEFQSNDYEQASILVLRKNSFSIMVYDQLGTLKVVCDQTLGFDVYTAKVERDSVKTEDNHQYIILETRSQGSYKFRLQGEYSAPILVQLEMIDDSTKWNGKMAPTRQYCIADIKVQDPLSVSSSVKSVNKLTVQRPGGILRYQLGLYIVINVDKSQPLQEKRPRLAILQWDETESPPNEIICHMPLNGELLEPLFMKPLKGMPGMFLLVTEYEVCLISESQISSGNLTFPRERFNARGSIPCAISIAEQEGKGHLAYVALDNGAVIRVIFSLNLSIHEIGRLPFGPTAMLILYPRNQESGKHRILAAGDTGQTGVYIINGHEIETVQMFYSSAPVLDLQLSKPAGATKEQVLLCAGIGNTGHLARPERGYRVQIHFYLCLSRLPNLVPHDLFKINFESSLVLLSFPWNSMILQLSLEGEVSDVTDLIDLDIAGPTICAFSSGDAIVQVTSQSVLACVPGQKKCVLVACDLDCISLASHVDGTLLLIFESQDPDTMGTSGFVMRQYLVRSGGRPDDVPCFLEEVPLSLKLKDEPTCLCFQYVFVGGKEELLWAVGFKNGSVMVKSCGPEGNFDPSPAIGFMSVYPELANSVSHSCIFVTRENLNSSSDAIENSDQDSTFLLFTTRCGRIIALEYIVYDLRTKTDVSPSLRLCASRKISDTPMRFARADSALRQAYLIGDEYMCRVEMTRAKNMVVTPAFYDNRETPLVAMHTPSPLQCAGSEVQSVQNGLLALTKNSLSFGLVSHIPTTTSKDTVAVGQTPRRMIYDDVTDSFVVITRKGGSNACCHSQGMAVHEQTSNMQILSAVSLQLLSEIPLRETKSRKLIFRCGETVHGVISWKVPVGGETYRWICTGSGIQVSPGTSEGRIRIMRITRKPNMSLVDIKTVNSMRVSAPVWALATVGTYGLVYASGSCVTVKTWDSETKRFRASADSECFLRSPAISVDVRGSIIACATQRDSVCLLTYNENNGRLTLLGHDFVPRLSVTTRFLGRNRLIMSDKEKCLVCYEVGGDLGMCRLSVQRMPTVITKVAPVCVPLDHMSLVRAVLVMNGSEEDSRREDGTRGEESGARDGRGLERETGYVAAGLDGSIYGMTHYRPCLRPLLSTLTALHRRKTRIGNKEQNQETHIDRGDAYDLVLNANGDPTPNLRVLGLNQLACVSDDTWRAVCSSVPFNEAWTARFNSEPKKVILDILQILYHVQDLF